ncbi:MAG: hypothetical protein GXP40_07660 [Chloroflexi bacterium]|nr:hypothetical protein [Chloroflexota bacterium]
MTETLYCANHPTRETMLRCNRCEKPICPSCAVHTPTGYRCRECVREQQRLFDTAAWYDYLVGIGTTTLLSLVTSGIIVFVSFFAGFFMWFISVGIAAGAGVLIAKIALKALRGRRSKALFYTTAAGVILGVVPAAIFLILVGDWFSLIWQGIYVLMATPTVLYRISGIQL